MASKEDLVSRAVRLLTSRNSAARVACSVCGEAALRTTTESAHLGGSKGTWSRNTNVGALFVRTSGSHGANNQWSLLVKRGAVVLSAQQVIHTGIVHDINGTGFNTTLKSMTHHECYKCSKVPGQSLRLRVDAQVSIAAEVAYIDATLRMLIRENTTMRIGCFVCSADLHKGVLLAPSSIDNDPTATSNCTGSSQPRLGNKSVLKAYAMGGVETPVDDRNTETHGRLLYFSRNTGKNTEVGVLVWVVDQSLAVIEVDDMAEVFVNEATSYKFTSCNRQCESHQREYPQPCAVCAKSIRDEKDATTVEQIYGPVIPTPTTSKIDS